MDLTNPFFCQGDQTATPVYAIPSGVGTTSDVTAVPMMTQFVPGIYVCEATA
jgi:alcohol dehydrogenase class IV